MQWTSAPNIGEAPLPQRARSYWKARFSAAREGLERLLEAERAQLPPWFVIGFGSGIAAWFALGSPVAWKAFLSLAAGISLTKLEIDDSEFPFLVGVVFADPGDKEKFKEQIGKAAAYSFSGGVGGESGGTRWVCRPAPRRRGDS